MKDTNHIKLFNTSGHLTPEAISMCAEKMIDVRLHKNLPPPVVEHLEECMSCSNRAIGIYTTIKGRPEILSEITKGLHAKNKSSIPKVLKNNIGYIAGIAAVIILALFSITLLTFRTHSNEAFFDKYFYPYHNIVTTKSHSQTDLDHAMLYYSLADYQGSVIYLENVLAKEADNFTAMFYLANACLATGDASRAITLLEPVSSQENLFIKPAQWYLALANLRIGESEKARNLLQSLKANEGFWGMKAGGLLNQLPQD